MDPANQLDGEADVFIKDGKIEKVGKGLKVKADLTIDAKGKIVTPGPGGYPRAFPRARV